MKALLSMAKQKRKQQPLSKPKFQPQPSQPSLSQYDQDQQFEVDLQQICAFAQFIGIKLPEEEDLLWIAKQGLQAQLPPDWQQAQTEQGQIVYTNVRTGDIIMEHPCDEYYRQLVIKQRKKNQIQQAGGLNKLGQKKPIITTNNQFSQPFQPIGSLSSNSTSNILNSRLPVKQSQPIIDPLVKMQRQKQQKRLQQVRRKQHTQKKIQLKQKYQSKTSQIQKSYKQKQQKTLARFNQQLEIQKRQQLKQLSVKQQQRQKKKQIQLNIFQKQQKQKQQRQLQQRLKKQKQKMQKKYVQRKEELLKKLQNKLKNQKKQIDQVYKQKYKEIEEKQKNMKDEIIKLSDDRQLEEDVKNMKNQLIKKKMLKYSEKLKKQTQLQQKLYNEQISLLQSQHQIKLKKLQQSSQHYSQQFSSKQSSKLSAIIKQIQSYQKQQMKILQYQLNVMKQMKKIQNQQKLQLYKSQLHSLHRHKIQQIKKQLQKQLQRYKQFKQQQYQHLIYQAQKHAKQDYLNTLRLLQKRFNQQQQITILSNKHSNKSSKMNIVQKQNLQSLQRLYEQLQYQQKRLKEQRERIKKEIQQMREESLNHGGKLNERLNEQQMKLYGLIQDKIREKGGLIRGR